MAAKQEYDVIEQVFSTKQIPNTSDLNSPDNSEWWKKVYHSTEGESKQPEMYNKWKLVSMKMVLLHV